MNSLRVQRIVLQVITDIVRFNNDAVKTLLAAKLLPMLRGEICVPWFDPVSHACERVSHGWLRRCVVAEILDAGCGSCTLVGVSLCAAVAQS